MIKRIIKLLQRVTSLFVEPTIVRLLNDHHDGLNRQYQILLSLKYRELADSKSYCIDFDQIGFNLYSSTYEDGILLYIFSIIGTTNKKCVDIGSGAVMGSNVANLIVNHSFTGLLIDGNIGNILVAKEYYTRHPETRLFMPKLVSTIVTAENVNNILMENGFLGNVDLLVIDIDGIDYWIWKAIDVIASRVVVVEYQDILGPDKAWSIPYKSDFATKDYPVNEQYNNYSGASLRAFVKLGKQKGYRLVGCNRGGWNAIFVKEGIGEECLPEVTIESCFKYDWNQFGIEKRYPLVKDMDWQEV